MSETTKIAWKDLFRGRRAGCSFLLCFAIALYATNGLIATTALPSAVDEIGGLTIYSWATTVYMVASIISAACGGWLKLRIGARAGFVAAATVFAIGTVVCAAAPTMEVLLAGRALQGLAGGILAAFGHTLVRELYPEAMWPKVFALQSGVWGTAAFTGPLLGGVFASLGHWRFSFLSMVPVAIALAVLALVILPRTARRREAIAMPPLGRLAALGGAILLVAVSDRAGGAALSVLSVGVALAVIWWVLRRDSVARDRLLPSRPLSLFSPVGVGLWIVFTFFVATYGFTIFGPLLLQILEGVSPITAGYIVAFEALSWTIAALLTANLPVALVPVAIVAGPLMTLIGLAGIALFLGAGELPLLILSVFLSGAGVGTCWAFVCQAIMAGARPGEGDVAAGAIPTVQMIGAAVGSAVAGMIANAAGFADGMTVESARDVALWVHGGFVAVVLVTALMAIRLVTLGRARAKASALVPAAAE